jgi:hypothetical protein
MGDNRHVANRFDKPHGRTNPSKHISENRMRTATGRASYCTR